MFKKLLDKDYYFCLNWPVYLRPIWRFKLAEVSAFIFFFLNSYLEYKIDGFNIIFTTFIFFVIDIFVFYRHLRHHDSGEKVKFLWYRLDVLDKISVWICGEYNRRLGKRPIINKFFVSQRVSYLEIRGRHFDDVVFYFPLIIGLIQIMILIIDHLWPSFSYVVNVLIDYHLFSTVNEHSEILTRLGQIKNIPRQRMTETLIIYSAILSVIVWLFFEDKRPYIFYKIIFKEFIKRGYSKWEFLICYLSVIIPALLLSSSGFFYTLSNLFSLSRNQGRHEVLFNAAYSPIALFYSTIILSYCIFVSLFIISMLRAILWVAFFTKYPRVMKDAVVESNINLATQQKEGDYV